MIWMISFGFFPLHQDDDGIAPLFFLSSCCVIDRYLLEKMCNGKDRISLLCIILQIKVILFSATTVLSKQVKCTLQIRRSV